MLIVLVLRNVLRNLRRLIPMIVIIVAVFTAMVVGNAILAASGTSLYQTYARLVSGDLSISSASETNFTIFGSDQLLIGQYLIPDAIPASAELFTPLQQYPEVRAAAGVVSVSAVVDLAGRRQSRTLFGIDGDQYAALLPDLVLIAGELPRNGQPGMVVQDDGTPPSERIGRLAVITTQTGRTFTIREVPVTGVFAYPVEDSVLNTVALLDAETARSLAGYTYGGGADEIILDDEDTDIFGAEVDDLFGSSASDDGSADGDALGIDIDALLGGGTADSGGDTGDGTGPDIPGQSTDATPAGVGSDIIPGTWNFILVSLYDRDDRGTVIDRLQHDGYTEDAGYRVRDWYRTVGGNASLVRYLQILFNAGLVFVAIGAAIVATNALVLSVLERTKEIGTMRALGGSRGRVGAMIALETLIVVTGAGLIGIVLGSYAVGALSDAAIVIDNQYIQILFGGEPITGTVTVSLVLNHIGAAVALAGVSVLYPLKRAFAVSPREAMAA
ncbi:MAG: FtsX-like permease family protein [Spirochaeta sp.]|jgi:putative ABC transport system permease protein|nr:FtsX-like permease family protein [Spirochaeta sp.]